MSEQVQMLDLTNDRDASLKRIKWLKLDRVRGARMLVVGAGAIGNEVLKNLALLGVGHVYIFDKDTIEMSNLPRSILYRASDKGCPKALTAARAMEEINPTVQARATVGDVRFDLGRGLLRRMDCVIGCLDNNEARLSLNSQCMKVGVPWIDAGIDTMDGQVRVFSPRDGACYECSFTDEDYEEIALSCNALASMFETSGHVPTTPTIASIVAGVQVQEALKLLDPESWRGKSLVGRKFLFSGSGGAADFVGLTPRGDCGAHYTMEPDKIVELPALSASRTTVGELVETARARLGPNTTIELNFELAVKVTCPKCGTVTPLLQPELKLYMEQLWCGNCTNRPAEGQAAASSDRRTLRTHVTRTHLLGGSNNPITDELWNLKLAEIAVPPLDILEAQSSEGEVHYLELTGDAEDILYRAPMTEDSKPCEK